MQAGSSDQPCDRNFTSEVTERTAGQPSFVINTQVKGHNYFGQTERGIPPNPPPNPPQLPRGRRRDQACMHGSLPGLLSSLSAPTTWSLSPASPLQHVVREEKKNRNAHVKLKARSHIETQLNSTVELSWVSVSFDM